MNFYQHAVRWMKVFIALDCVSSANMLQAWQSPAGTSTLLEVQVIALGFLSDTSILSDWEKWLIEWQLFSHSNLARHVSDLHRSCESQGFSDLWQRLHATQRTWITAKVFWHVFFAAKSLVNVVMLSLSCQPTMRIRLSSGSFDTSASTGAFSTGRWLAWCCMVHPKTALFFTVFFGSDCLSVTIQWMRFGMI